MIEFRTIVKKSLYIKLYGILFLSGGVLLFLYNKGTLLLNINSFANEYLDSFFIYFTEAGNGWIITPFAILLLLYRYYYGVIVWSSLLLTGIVVSIFKRIVFAGLPRPRMAIDDSLFHHIIDGFSYAGSNSFPSGHTMTAFSFFTVLAFCFPGKWRELLFLFFAGTVAFSRMYLLQHFFIDVYFGSLFAVLNAFCAVYIANRFFKTDTSRCAGLLFQNRKAMSS